jgi:hypothetical protein
MKTVSVTAFLALLIFIPFLSARKKETVSLTVDGRGTPAPDELRYDIYDFVS